MLNKPQVKYPFFHCVTPSWDNSARRKENAVIIHQSTPSLYEYWLEKTIKKTKKKGNDIIFINAWNEWAEGNHLEPCQRWGTEYLEATQKAIFTSNNINNKE